MISRFYCCWLYTNIGEARLDFLCSISFFCAVSPELAERSTFHRSSHKCWIRYLQQPSFSCEMESRPRFATALLGISCRATMSCDLSQNVISKHSTKMCISAVWNRYLVIYLISSINNGLHVLNVASGLSETTPHVENARSRQNVHMQIMIL